MMSNDTGGFIDYYKEIEGLVAQFEARQENLSVLKKLKTKLGNNNSPRAIALQRIVREASAVFSDPEQYKKYWFQYCRYFIEDKVDKSLFGDQEVSSKEMEMILNLAEELGIPRNVTRQKVIQLAQAKGGRVVDDQDQARRQFGKPPPAAGQSQPQPQAQTQTPQPQPRPQPGAQQSGTTSGSSRSSAKQGTQFDNLSSDTKSNIATGIAATLALIYLLMGVAFVRVNWGYLILPLICIIISVKNFGVPVKRHLWGLSATAFLYFLNTSLLIVLLPTILLWHWGPVVFSKIKLSAHAIWVLPLLLCFGIYSSAYAINRVPHNSSPQGFVAPVQPPSIATAQNRKTGRDPSAKNPPAPQTKRGTSTPNFQQSAQTSNDAKTNRDQSQPKSIRTNEGHPQSVAELAKQETQYTFLNAASDFVLYSNEGIQSAGIFVASGDSLAVTTSEDTEVKILPGLPPLGPEGAVQLGPAGEGFLAPHCAGGAVLGRVGPDGTWFKIGKGFSSEILGNGELFVAVNDVRGGFDDNFGIFKLKIVHKQRQAKRS